MTYILEDRFKFKALYNGKIYDVKSFCDEFVKIYTVGNAKTSVNHVDKILLKDITKLLQCTGLKDKNGTLIYEGDILQETVQRELTYTGKLIGLFSINGYPSQILKYVIDDRGAHFKYNLVLPMNDCVVIGNICEHSFLLDALV